jgi:N-acetylglutamate synthase-like GNAT family acetyltransferase
MNYYYSETIEYLSVIQECFATDKELIEKWHVLAPCDLESCVRKTYFDLRESPSLKLFTLHKRTDDTDEVIGFFGREEIQDIKFLTSFFIKPKFRNKEVLSFFWDVVGKEIGTDLFSALYSNNSRAQKFLERNGFNLIQITELPEKKEAFIYHKN